MWSRADSPLWVVTSYFNPCRYRKRYENFVKFRDALRAPLLVVELQEHGAFELSKDDADVLLQLQGEPAIWQKERLLNIGTGRLPAHVNYVAWIDCDLVFENDQWVSDAISKLNSGTDLVQLFAGIVHQEESQQDSKANFGVFAPDHVHENSAAKMLLDDGNSSNLGRFRNSSDRKGHVRNVTTASGHAWAARVDRRSAGQLYDANIIGGGDRIQLATTFTIPSEIDRFISRELLSDPHYAHIKTWMDHRGLRTVDYVPGRAFHYWHGTFENRQYRERKKILLRHNFDPTKDLKLSANGAWQWTNPDGPLAKDVATYFKGRQEDG